MKQLGILLAFVLILSGCKDKCFKNTGDIVKETRSLTPFGSLAVYDNINLVLSTGPIQDVQVEAGEKLIGDISTVVENNHLIIKNNNKCDWLRSYEKQITVYISHPNLAELYNYSTVNVSNVGQQIFDTLIIHNYGNGNLTMNIKCDKLKVDTNFLGDIILSGESTEVYAHCFRLARLDTRNLKCQNLEILSEAEGDVFVYAENSLKGTIKSIGSVHYYGNPVNTDFNDQGKGEFVKN